MRMNMIVNTMQHSALGSRNDIHMQFWSIPAFSGSQPSNSLLHAYELASGLI